MSPLSTIRSGFVCRIRWIAVVATMVRFGLSAVNCTSDSVAKSQALSAVASWPSAENSGSATRSGCAGRSIEVGTSASNRSSTKVPAFWFATAVLMPWKLEIEIGNTVSVGSVQVAYCQSGLAVSAVP